MVPSGAWNFQCSEEAAASCLEMSGKISMGKKKSCVLIKGKGKDVPGVKNSMGTFPSVCFINYINPLESTLQAPGESYSSCESLASNTNPPITFIPGGQEMSAQLTFEVSSRLCITVFPTISSWLLTWSMVVPSTMFVKKA